MCVCVCVCIGFKEPIYKNINNIFKNTYVYVYIHFLFFNMCMYICISCFSKKLIWRIKGITISLFFLRAHTLLA